MGLPAGPDGGELDQGGPRLAGAVDRHEDLIGGVGDQFDERGEVVHDGSPQEDLLTRGAEGGGEGGRGDQLDDRPRSLQLPTTLSPAPRSETVTSSAPGRGQGLSSTSNPWIRAG